MLTNAMPRYAPLSAEALALIHGGWERLGREVGVQFDNPEALRLFAEAGQTVDGETVRFDPGFLRAQAALAPATFRMRARNAERDLAIGGDSMVFCAVQGPPFVRRAGEHYVLRVRGNSMVDEQISDGDYVVVHDRPSADNGEMVIAMLEDSGATVKRF